MGTRIVGLPAMHSQGNRLLALVAERRLEGEDADLFVDPCLCACGDAGTEIAAAMRRTTMKPKNAKHHFFPSPPPSSLLLFSSAFFSSPFFPCPFLSGGFFLGTIGSLSLSAREGPWPRPALAALQVFCDDEAPTDRAALSSLLSVSVAISIASSIVRRAASWPDRATPDR